MAQIVKFCLLSAATATTSLKFEWVLSTPLPSARSDLTATRINNDVFLAGGCSADQIWDPSYGMYFCPTVTNACSVFDIQTLTYSSCATLPVARYRHAADAVAGRVWLLGGRAVDDSIIQSIDVFDPATGNWSTVAQWAGATSDLGAFAVGDDLFVVGGYDVYYENAVTSLIKIDTAQTMLSGSLVSVPLSPMRTGRGDTFAAVLGATVYVSGGFTHTDWCSPLSSVERYDIASDTWTEAPALGIGRGDKAVVTLGAEWLLAIGGETKDANCSAIAVPLDDVELLAANASSWVQGTTLLEERFRFVAVADSTGSSVYIFGGQKYYNATCNCFAVSEDVMALRITEVVVSAADPRSIVAGLALAVAAVLL